MKSVWKFPLEPMDYQEIDLPKGAKPLCVKMQKGNPYLWVLVDTKERERETITIRCAGTGHLISEENLEYLGTAIMLDDTLVFHFFKV